MPEIFFMGFTSTSSQTMFQAISWKTKEPNLKNDKKPNFGADFDTFGLFAPNLAPKPFLWVLPLLHVTYCCKLSLYPISRKTNEPNLKKQQKI